MRILQVIGSLAARYGGPSTACPALCRALAEAGHEVVIYTTDAGVARRKETPLDRPVRKDGYEIRYFPAWRHPREFKISTGLFAGLRAELSGFDVVHIYSYYGFWVWAAVRTCCERGVPFLLHPHGSLDPFLLGRHSIRKGIYARTIGERCWGRAAGLLFNSEEERRLALGGRSASSKKTSPPSFVVPVGIEPEWFEEPGYAAEERVRQLLPNCTESPESEWIVFFGRLDFKKGLDLLVRAFAELARRRPLVRLILAGPESPGYAAKVRGWLDREGLLDRATFTGPLEGRARVALVRRARLLALLSYSENFGQVVAEAMAARVPVVISNRVNISGDIAAARAGIVVPCDASRAANAMQTVLDDSAGAEQMGERGRVWAERYWTWPVVAEQMLAAYASVIGRAPESAPAVVLAGHARS
jgi:glycosyltransferase involved in cell wall biosynthesis